MNIKLILPATPAYRVTPDSRSVPRRAMLRFSVLPLTTVAALTPPEHAVELVDENVRPLDFDAPCDLAAVSFMTAYAPRAFEIAREFRKRGVTTVAGGFHPSFCPDETLGHFDVVVQGDAEGLWPRVVDDVAAGRPQRLYRHDAPPDLALSPPPRRDLTAPWGKHYATLFAVQTGRGCAHGCRFCSITAFHGGTFRRKPLENVLAEIRSAPRNFMFVDDNLIADPAFARELFTAMIPLKKHWVSQCTLRLADDPELLALAKRAGCVGIFVGLESITAENLADVGKGVNLEGDSLARIRAIRKAGIGVQAAVIVGLDHDDVTVFRRTLDFLRRARLDALQLSILTPLPGTPLYDDFKAAGRMRDSDWAHYDFRHTVFEPARMAAEQLQAGADWLYREFYRLDRVLLRSWRALLLGGPAAAVFCLRLNLTYRYDNVREHIRGVDPAVAEARRVAPRRRRPLRFLRERLAVFVPERW
ncbi:MAG: B12-binding domain-containing radical SAM protein [Acidobacteria bacterium]|nr:B12-binding domain-containing radical SAM protein [Acidobacteriota bacterium]